MDVNDLMIGDLITFKECQKDENPMPIEIVALGYQQGGGCESSLVSINGDKACDIFDIDDEIVGIPLTPEILEKNGFKAQGCYEFTYMDDYCFIKVSCVPDESPDGEIVHVSDVNIEGALFRITIIIEYLHELQHALKLCGIDFKIKL